ncbi:epoxide hydrolase N-terminal domain-containing protein [Streptomyces sp. NPDC005096]|uniref:epoxide hydrolase N-terminal domain-containing protein n=1 Tax=Streptomyces sp. NPDC005096 TaxID=3154559 RepID=UPI0033B6C80B
MSVTPDRNAIRPLTFEFRESKLEALRARLEATRFPKKETVADHSQGVPLETRLARPAA